MTWLELANLILAMPEKYQSDDVTVVMDDEVWPVVDKLFVVADVDNGEIPDPVEDGVVGGVLDDCHRYLRIKTEE